MAQDDNKHAAWNFKVDYHKGEKYGCIWRHNGDKYKDTECDHKKNAFEASKSRDDMYKKDHRGNAYALGFVDSQFNLTDKAQKEIQDYAHDRNVKKSGDKSYKVKDKKWVKKYFKKFKTSIYWLEKDKNAWTVEHQIPNISFGYAGNSKTFVPRPQGGPGAWFPYFHNAHHIVPQGAFRDFVIYGEGETDPALRLKIVLSTNWNINYKDNMVILPQELQVSAIAELPAHCPYGHRNHLDYSSSVKDKLADVRKKIDKAVKTEKCEDIDEVELLLEDIPPPLLEKIKEMKSGQQIGGL